jgi:hypothetical protein
MEEGHSRKHMIRNFLSRTVRFMGVLLAAMFDIAGGAVRQGPKRIRPLFRSNWGKPIAPQGFGDRQNSWAWSMAWFNGNLLVGTARSEQCITDLSNTRSPSEPYPPKDPDISCPARILPI